MIILVMGVSGSGKTTVGQRLADRLGWPFFDGDDFHPQANIDKMACGEPLTDEDRWPWLDALGDLMDTLTEEGRSAVIACSALKKAYRQRLSGGRPAVTIVYLKGTFDLIRSRMAMRAHFFRPELLQSQFDALEEPDDALTVPVDAPPEAIVQTIRDALGV